jgi:hypothetical protein
MLSIALVGALGLVPLVPAEHAHRTDMKGHSQIVIHQHAQPHAIGHLPGGTPAGRTVFDHPDDPVLTLSTVFTVPLPHQPPVPDRPVVLIVEPPQRDAREALMGPVERSIHGPPRPGLSLRGPPPACLA